VQMDRRFIRRYCLLSFSFASRPTLLINGLLVHPTVPIQSGLLRSVPSTPMLASMVPSVHPTVAFLSLSFLVFDP
jgi:hypothetical protein